MRVLFSPIVGFDKDITYVFAGNSVTVTIGNIEDTFDFAGIPDGFVEYLSIETDLTINPIVGAEKINGVLYLKLINPIPEDATEFQKFPNWIEVSEDGEV